MWVNKYMIASILPNPESGQKKSNRSKRPTNYPGLEKKGGKIRVFKRDDYFIDDRINFHGGSQKRSGFKLTMWSWMSALIDSLILISISCFTVILFSFLMKTPARDLLKFVVVEPNLAKMCVFSFFFSFWVYLVMMRIFMGASLGEWSCQLRLGQPTQRIKTTYIVKVVARTTLILITGVVTLPLLSLLFKEDLVGELTGLRLYSLV